MSNEPWLQGMTQDFHTHFPPLLFPVLSCLFFLCTAQWSTHSDGSSARNFSSGLKRRGSSFGKAEELQAEFSTSRSSWLSWEELTPLGWVTPMCLSFSLLFCLLMFNLSHFRACSEAQTKEHTTKCPPQSYHVLCRHFPQITFSSLQCSLFPWWPLGAAQLAGTKFSTSGSQFIETEHQNQELPGLEGLESCRQQIPTDLCHV